MSLARNMLPDGKNGALDVGTVPRLHVKSVQANMALKLVLAIALGHNANQLLCIVMHPAMASAHNFEAMLFVLEGTTASAYNFEAMLFVLEGRTHDHHGMYTCQSLNISHVHGHQSPAIVQPNSIVLVVII